MEDNKKVSHEAETKATDELKKFEEIKLKEKSEATRRMVEAFSDCG